MGVDYISAVSSDRLPKSGEPGAGGDERRRARQYERGDDVRGDGGSGGADGGVEDECDRIEGGIGAGGGHREMARGQDDEHWDEAGGDGQRGDMVANRDQRDGEDRVGVWTIGRGDDDGGGAGREFVECSIV